MPKDYFGRFLKDSDKIFRDANGLIKRNYQTLEENIRKETRRMKERVDCLNRMRELENTLQKEGQKTDSPSEQDKKFLELIETIHRIVDCLQNVHTLCSPMLAENPNVNPGAMESDISQLEQDRQLLREQVNDCRQLIGMDNSSYAPHQTFLNQLDGVLQGRVLRTVCLELRNVVDRGDIEQIKQYGDLAGTLIQQFDGMISVLNWELSTAEEGSHVIPTEDNNRNDRVL